MLGRKKSCLAAYITIFRKLEKNKNKVKNFKNKRKGEEKFIKKISFV